MIPAFFYLFFGWLFFLPLLRYHRADLVLPVLLLGVPYLLIGLGFLGRKAWAPPMGAAGSLLLITLALPSFFKSWPMIVLPSPYREVAFAYPASWGIYFKWAAAAVILINAALILRYILRRKGA